MRVNRREHCPRCDMFSLIVPYETAKNGAGEFLVNMRIDTEARCVNPRCPDVRS